MGRDRLVMQFSFIKNNIIAFVTVVVLAVILLYTIISAYSLGKLSAQATVVNNNAHQLLNAVDYFYNDQNRFPSADEFSDFQSMNSYSTRIPQNIASGSCSTSYSYKRISRSSMQLSMCLPYPVGGFPSGWHTFLINH